ncbi:MAG TPA: hypothetical protein VK425_09045, partial [Acidimicrobiales bacterium]|nr:hypothetical protein [Acidimicrobiales bacterium]
LQGSSGTIGLQGPPGTIFPNSPGYYHVVDSTASTGSGTVTAGLSGGGTNDVSFIVPNTINAGDVLSVAVEDVINPSTPSSTYSVTLVGPVTGPVPTPVTTTTAPQKPAPNTKPKPKPVPVVALLTDHVKVKSRAVVISLRCSRARCRGQVVLKDVNTMLGYSSYNLPATGRAVRLPIALDKAALRLLNRAEHHTIEARGTVKVTNGHTLQKKVTVVLG